MTFRHRSYVRRFRIIWSDLEVTLSDQEYVSVGVLSDTDKIVLVEYSPGSPREGKPGWGRRHQLLKDDDVIVTDISESVAQMYVQNCLRRAIMNRYRYHGDDGTVWILNQFLGYNEPLALAETSVWTLDAALNIPRWVDPRQEVTGNQDYGFYRLASDPWSRRKK